MTESWLDLMATDAVATARGLGYRPCGRCGNWLPKKVMTEGSADPETGEPVFFCAICEAEVNHLLEVNHA